MKTLNNKSSRTPASQTWNWLPKHPGGMTQSSQPSGLARNKNSRMSFSDFACPPWKQFARFCSDGTQNPACSLLVLDMLMFCCGSKIQIQLRSVFPNSFVADIAMFPKCVFRW